MRDGWIKLHRSLLEWEWYDDIPTKCLFFHFLLSANHAPSKWRGIGIGRGQMWTSIGSLSNKCGLTAKQVRIAIDKLEKTGEVKSEGASNGTMITVCKYDTYQSYEDEGGKPKGKLGAKEGQRKGEVGATNNKNNNPKNNEEEQEVEGVTAPHPLVKWIESNAPTIQRLREPLTNEQAERILTDLNIDTEPKKKQLRELLMNMENYKPLTTKSKSANLTIRKWWAKQGEYNGTAPATEKITITKGVYYK